MSPAVARVAPCEVRPAKAEDLPFVIDTWVKHGYRDLRISEATRIVRAILSREASRLGIAHVPGESDALLGWAAMESGEVPCLHYVYVRRAGRRQGIAARLVMSLRELRIEYSRAAPAEIAVPTTWTLNLKRAETP